MVQLLGNDSALKKKVHHLNILCLKITYYLIFNPIWQGFPGFIREEEVIVLEPVRAIPFIEAFP